MDVELQTAFAKLEMESIVHQALINILIDKIDDPMLGVQLHFIRNDAEKVIKTKYPLAKLD